MKRRLIIAMLLGMLGIAAPTAVCADIGENASSLTTVGMGLGDEKAQTPSQQVINGKKYMVYPDGSHYTGWFSMADAWVLYFDPEDDGAAVTGLKAIGEKVYLFNGDGLLYQTSGTPAMDGKKYWTNEDGSVNNGWLQLGEWKMYFDPQSYEAKTGLSDIDGKKYIFDNNGIMQSYAGTPVINGKKYWFSSDGSLRSGWLYLNSWKLYFDEITYEGRVGLSEVEGKRYIFDDNGVLVAAAGTPVINGKKYWFAEDGSLQTGWLYLGDWKMYFDEESCEARIGLSTIGEKRYIFDENGVLVSAAGTPVINGKKYWFAPDGSLQTGWLQLGSWKMYFKEGTCEAAIGVCAIDGKSYAFDNNGIMLSGSGLAVVNGKKYYFNGDGSINTGWVTIGNWRMYFDPTTGAAAVGVTTVEGKKLLFDENGVQLTGNGMVVLGGKKYYFASDGSVITGWVTIGNWTLYFDPVTGVAATGMVYIDGQIYYFNSDGVKCAGVQFFNGRSYYFDANGALLKNRWTTINGEKIYVDGNGIGLTDLSARYPGPYKLLVDRTNCVVTAYARDCSGRYTIPVRSMLCSVGLSGTATPSGTYNISATFTLKELMGPSWGKWACRVVGGIYFHSVATGSASDPTHTVPAGEYNKLGSPASHGCIRLCVRDAKWIYDHCGLGTTVQIGDNYALPFGKPFLTKISGSVDPTDPAA